MTTVPTLLVCDEIIESIAMQKLEWSDHQKPTPANFLFSYALFEGLLRELSFELYYAFPAKLKGLDNVTTNSNNTFEIEKNELLLTNDYYFVLKRIIDKRLYKLSKDNLFNLLNFFFKHSGIYFEVNEDLLFQMTKARNIIAHNNGYKVRSWTVESEMFDSIIEESSLKQYNEYILNLMESIELKLDEKFENYTYEKLLLDSWNYTCPKLSIYDVFDFQTGKAQIKIESAIKCIRTLTATDKYLVSLWIENNNINDMYYIMSKVGEVYPSTHIAKVNELHYLQQFFKDFPYLFEGHPFLIDETGKLKV